MGLDMMNSDFLLFPAACLPIYLPPRLAKIGPRREVEQVLPVGTAVSGFELSQLLLQLRGVSLLDEVDQLCLAAARSARKHVDDGMGVGRDKVDRAIDRMQIVQDSLRRRPPLMRRTRVPE